LRDLDSREARLESEAARAAAKLFVQARATGALLDRLPEGLRPRDSRDAYAIQLETIEQIKDNIAGWKVALSKEYDLLVGALIRSRIFEAGATISASDMALVGVEAEIAFRFDKALPPRERPYDRDEIAEAVTAFPAIEILDSRFRDYEGTPVIDRAADFMSNSAFVVGRSRGDWRSFDLSKLEARLMINGVELVRQVGGHAAGDPLIPAIALVNQFRASDGVLSGRLVTTGSYTGLQFVRKNCSVQAIFDGFGAVDVEFSS
jgi:2-keto-4-pentenoate hydratase